MFPHPCHAGWVMRVKGATSCVRINLMELNRVLKPNATVIVNRKYADALNLACQPFKVSANQANIIEAVNDGIDKPEDVGMAIGIQIENYDD